MAFPTSITAYSATAGGDTPNATAGIGLSGLLNAFEVDITALGTKVGTGSSTPVANTLLYGTGTGTSAWQGLTSAQLASIVSDETGSGSLVFGNSPTIVTPTVASFINATHDHSNSAGGGTLTHTAFPTGVAVQQVSSLTTAFATGTTVIPFDDTIPQNTEGDQYMTLAITPKTTTNVLVINVMVYGANSAGTQDVTIALFQDSTANALAASSLTSGGTNFRLAIPMLYTMTAGTTSATTFKVRAGNSSSGTFTFNGVSGGRSFGAITKSYMTITEYKA